MFLTTLHPRRTTSGHADAHRRRLSSALVAVGTASFTGLALLAGVPSAAAAPPSEWERESRSIHIDDFRSNEQLQRDLDRLERKSRGVLQVDEAGRSNEGRPIDIAKVGNGPRKVLIVSQQHGNEPHGTEAVVEVLETLTGRDRGARELREELTVWAVVRDNPDGAERPWRQNVDPECPRDAAHCTPGRGWDPNRFHDPRLTAAEVPAPETLVVREAFDEFDPELVLDLHGQLSYLSEAGIVDMSVVWPVLRDEGADGDDDGNPGGSSGGDLDYEVSAEALAAVDYSKQVTALIADEVGDVDDAVVTKFPGGDGDLATARNAYGFQGAATVLIEQRSDIGTQQASRLVRQGFVAVMSVLDGVADGSVNDYDPADAESLPERGERYYDPAAENAVDECTPGDVLPELQGTEVLTRQGDLYTQYVEPWRNRHVERYSNAYDEPTVVESCTMAAAYQRLVDGDSAGAAGLVDRFDYDVIEYQHTADGEAVSMRLLSERLGSDGRFGRGWGFFAYRVDSGAGDAATTTISATYPESATFSERLAAQTFLTAGARDLMVAGAHREANDANVRSYEPANVTLDPDSVLQRLHQQVVEGPDDVALSVLGGSGDGVVVTSGLAPPLPFATELADVLVAEGYDVCLFGAGCDRLQSRGNEQGRVARALGADWAAVYPNFDIRRLASNRQDFADAVTLVLGS